VDCLKIIQAPKIIVQFFTIAESPLNENVIWAGTDDGNIQLTKDGGKSWTNVVATFKDYLKIW
jgi:photosystem II stability/assembly factor-like uncharacterized protein